MNLKDSSMVVIGGGSGIGRGIAQEAVRRGAKVTLVDRRRFRRQRELHDVLGAE